MLGKVFIGKKSFRLDIIILIIMILFILFFHLFGSCARISPFEAFTDIKDNIKKNITKNDKINNTLKNKKEGFDNIRNFQNAETFSKAIQTPIDIANWKQSNLTPNSIGLDKLNSYKNTPLPLKNTMLLFKDTEFKPECCGNGNTFSLSQGCACMNVDTAKYLWQRGGNNSSYIPGSI